MPAQFDPSTNTALTALKNLFAHPTGFGTRVKSFLTAHLDAVTNPFGTAATEDTNVAQGVPTLGAGGVLPSSVLPDASASAPGMAILGDAQTPDTPAALDSTIIAAFLAPYLGQIYTAAFSDLFRISTRSYGLGNNQRAAFNIGRVARIVVISANGGVANHPALLTAPSVAGPTIDGDSIRLLDTDGNTLVTIRGGRAPQLRRYPITGRSQPAGYRGSDASNHSPTRRDTSVTIVQQNALDALNLHAAIILHGRGARGQRAGSITADGFHVSWAEGGNADLFIGVTQQRPDLTENPQWLTDNPASPYWITPSNPLVRNAAEFGYTYGYAYSIRLGDNP